MKSHLIIVPGHASFNENVLIPIPVDFMEDRYWALRAFQAGPLKKGDIAYTQKPWVSRVNACTTLA